MPDLKISQLPDADGINGDELVPVVQNGVTVKMTAQTIANIAPGGGTVTAFALINNVGDFITSSHVGISNVITDCGNVGRYQINFESGFFLDAPAIACGMFQNDPRVGYEIIDVDQNQCVIQIYAIDDGAQTDMPFTIMAVGQPGVPD
jgi:hypothetical protein